MFILSVKLYSKKKQLRHFNVCMRVGVTVVWYACHQHIYYEPLFGYQHVHVCVCESVNNSGQTH